MKKKLLIYSIVLIGVFACTNQNSKFMVIGHRGAMGHETENTLASIQKAMDLGVDMIEIDVFKIESGEIVVFHDDDVERLTNGDGNIEEYNIDDLKKLILNGNHQIPMLQDILKLIDNKVILNIELKGSNTADKVNRIVNYYVKEKGWSADNFIISSFRWDELKKMREYNPDIAIAILAGENPLDAIAVAKELKAVAINPNFETLNIENVSKIKEAGFKIYTWTVNEPSDIENIKGMGVDGIITNYPERIQ